MKFGIRTILKSSIKCHSGKSFKANIASFILFSLMFFCLAVTVSASDKKGVGLADLRAPERIAQLNVAWYYTWQPQAIPGAPLEKFVPMLRSRGGRLLKEQISFFQTKGKVPLLLVLNEPDKFKGDNMSVEEVIRVWPEISVLADQISSPAPAGVLGSWFDKFYRKAKSQHFKFDFMAVHLYSPPDAELFLKKIDAVYEKYQIPIWITEFAVADWESKDKPNSNRYTEAQVLAFMKSVLPELEKRPYVVRYAWFGAGKHSLSHEQVRTSRLFEKDGKLTPLGHYYAEFEWPLKQVKLKVKSLEQSEE